MRSNCRTEVSLLPEPFVRARSRAAFVAAALDLRLHEFDQQAAAVREGMAEVLPLPLLALFAPAEMEQLVAGHPCINLALLRTVAEYRPSSVTSDHVVFRW